MNNKPKDRQKETGHADLFFPDSDFSKSICSTTDCTGLIPALPDSEAELEAYEEMYQFCGYETPTAASSSMPAETPKSH